MTLPFPFVVGCGRSGSTLLRLMLDAHPDFVVPMESYFVEQLLRRSDGFVVDGRFDRQLFEVELFADFRFRTWGLPADRVLDEFRRAEPRDVADAIRGVYRAAAHQSGAKRYGDKTPSYSLCMEQIASALPEAVFVHLVRDPRDVAASYRSTSWGPRTLTAAGAAWRRRVGAARRAGSELGPDRYMELRYEALVEDPASELARVCEFIDLSFMPEMLSYSDGAAAAQTATLDGGAHRGVLRAPTIGVRNWRSDLSSGEAARVGAVTDSLAAELGYEAGPQCRGFNRVRSVAERGAAAGEGVSLSFRRTRLANRLRGAWRHLRRRATPEQLGLVAAATKEP